MTGTKPLQVQFFDTQTGEQDGFDANFLILETAIGSVTGAVASGAAIDDPNIVRISGVTVGDGNPISVLEGFNARIANGEDIVIPPSVAARGAAAEVVASATRDAAAESLKTLLKRVTNSDCEGLSVPCQK